MAEHNIDAIDLVVVNLYPFAATVAKPNCSLADAIENIDIGGPTMVRAAAKNHASVGIVVNASDYATVIAEMKNSGALSYETRFDLAVKAFEHTAQYDGMIASYLGARVGKEEGTADKFARTLQYSIEQSARFTLRRKPASICSILCSTLLQLKLLFLLRSSFKVKNYLITTLQIPMPHLNV